MVLQSLFQQVAGKSARAATLIRRLAGAGAILALAIPVQHAAAGTGGVYVAGQGAGLDQAFSRALADNPAKSAAPFWVVVAGKEIAKTTKTGASPAVAGWIKTALDRGGLVYVCRTDMMNAGIREGDLLDGVHSMYGYDAKDWAGLLPARKEGITLPDNMQQSQQILKACAGNPKP
ncbi:MAG TPA: hypothetical protein VGE12_17250 [Noviherbaspirillum sp.]